MSERAIAAQEIQSVIVAHRLTLCTLLTQAVWKRFSYPNNSKQPGVMDLDATV